MKSKTFLLILVGILFIGFFSSELTDTSVADSTNYEISIVEKSYEVAYTENIYGRDYVFFNISIKLANLGDVVSDDITVRIWGEDLLEVSSDSKKIPAQGYEYFNITAADNNFFLEGLWSHTINISYFPTDEGVDFDSRNSGRDGLITESLSDTEESTPGFEWISIVIAFIVVFLIRKRR